MDPFTCQEEDDIGTSGDPKGDFNFGEDWRDEKESD